MKIKEYIIDDTPIKAGPELIWLSIAIEPIDKEILLFHTPKGQNML